MRKRVFVAMAAAVVVGIVAVTIMLHVAQARVQAKGLAVQVRVDNFTFDPVELTVPVNSTVAWVNKDDVPHVIASDTGIFKSRALDTDEGYSYTFTKPGTYLYHCSMHPKMVAKVVVQ